MKKLKNQQGIALLIFVTVLLTAATTVTVKALKNSSQNIQIERDKITAAALAQAKDALIGYASTYKDTHLHVPFYMNGYLPTPDMGSGNSEGITSGSFSGNYKDRTVIGKLPWKTLGIATMRDGQGECLWYVISGRFKNTPQTDSLNWDTQGQINVIDASGNTIASNLAALLLSAGSPLDGQSRALIDTNHGQCGGNYDARNYLDAYSLSTALASGEVNYFSGSTNNSRASDSNSKNFVLANTEHYNDQLMFITVDELFRSIIHRTDFTNQINSLLNDGVFLSEVGNVVVSVGNKGTSNINCANTSNVDNKSFCTNWKDMLLLTKLPASASITIDGVATTVCQRVLIFGGQKTATQARVSSSDKTTPANYLENNNLTSFATPTSANSLFNGVSNFSANNPSADILRCIP